MACKDYRELLDSIVINPESDIPQGWEKHAGSCKSCIETFNNIKEDREVNGFLKKSFLKIKKEIQNEYPLPEILTEISFSKNVIKKRGAPSKNKMNVLEIFDKLALKYKIIIPSVTLFFFIILIFKSYDNNKLNTSVKTPKNPKETIKKDKPRARNYNKQNREENTPVEPIIEEKDEKPPKRVLVPGPIIGEPHPDPTNAWLQPIKEKEVYETREEELKVKSRKIWRDILRDPKDSEKRRELRKILEEIGDKKNLQLLDDMEYSERAKQKQQDETESNEK